MSKSRGNTVSPDEFIEKYGSDTFRAYIMFMGPYDEGGDWNDTGITGISRFINKIWKFCQLPDSENEADKKDLQVLHQTIRSVTIDMYQMKFNTAISRLMECMNHFSAHADIQSHIKREFIKIIAPLVPHIAEELWEINGGGDSVFLESFPVYDKLLAEEDTITIAVQVNGKLRGNIEVVKTINNEDLLTTARDQVNVSMYLKGKEMIKEIVVPQRLVNFVVK